MKKIILLKGLPASGKSTRAKEMVVKNPGQYKRVNKDDLRAMIDCGRYSKSNERMIIDIRNQVIVQSLANGVSIIVDDTNFHPKHEETLKLIAKERKASFEIKFFDTPLDECIARDSKRLNPVGEKVIRSMYNEYLKPKFITMEQDTKLPSCIIVDIDGTLAEKGDRDIYDGSKVYLDTVIEPVRLVCNTFCISQYKLTKIIIVSGRDSKYRDVTKKRLIDNHIYFNYLFMRNEGDNRDDTIIKKEIYDEHIKNKYNVLFVLDDRTKVVDQWRAMGLYTFDCNQTRLVF